MVFTDRMPFLAPNLPNGAGRGRTARQFRDMSRSNCETKQKSHSSYKSEPIMYALVKIFRLGVHKGVTDENASVVDEQVDRGQGLDGLTGRRPVS